MIADSEVKERTKTAKKRRENRKFAQCAGYFHISISNKEIIKSQFLSTEINMSRHVFKIILILDKPC